VWGLILFPNKAESMGQDKEILDLLRPLSGSITVLSLTGHTVTIADVPATTTIAQLKLLYQDRQGVSPDQQYFVYPIPARLLDAIKSEDSNRINASAAVAKVSCKLFNTETVGEKNLFDGPGL
jgi:hypothetical protein